MRDAFAYSTSRRVAVRVLASANVRMMCSLACRDVRSLFICCENTFKFSLYKLHARWGRHERHVVVFYFEFASTMRHLPPCICAKGDPRACHVVWNHEPMPHSADTHAWHIPFASMGTQVFAVGCASSVAYSFTVRTCHRSSALLWLLRSIIPTCVALTTARVLIV